MVYGVGGGQDAALVAVATAAGHDVRVVQRSLSGPWTVTGIQQQQQIRYAVASDMPLPWSSLQNQAEFMVAAMGRRELDGCVMDIAWPDRFTGRDVAEAISQAVDQPIEFVSISPSELADVVRPHWGDAAAEHIETLYALLCRDDAHLLDRDFMNACAVLKPSLSSLTQWAKTSFGPLAEVVS